MWSELSWSLQSPCLWQFTTIWKYQQHENYPTPETTCHCQRLKQPFLLWKRFFSKIFTYWKYSFYKQIHSFTVFFFFVRLDFLHRCLMTTAEYQHTNVLICYKFFFERLTAKYFPSNCHFYSKCLQGPCSQN